MMNAETLFARVKDLAAADAAGDSSGPTIEMDAPAWALREDAGRDRVTAAWGVALLVGACALVGALGGLLIFALESSNADNTVRDTLAIAFAANVALLALLGRTILSKSDPAVSLRIGIHRRQPAAKTHEVADIVRAALGVPADASSASPATTAIASPSDGKATIPSASAPAPDPGSGLSAFISKEPVIVQGLVLVAGSLALAFSTNLQGAEVGGIAAAAAGALTLLTRTATTSVAAPRGVRGEPLTPASEAEPTASSSTMAAPTATAATP